MSVILNSPNVVIGHMSGGTININTTNPEPARQAQPACEDVEPIEDEKTSPIPPDFFCISKRFTEENIRERLAAELSQSTTKIDYCRALYRLQHIGCINLNQYASDAQRAIVFNNYQTKFDLAPNDFCRARSSI